MRELTNPYADIHEYFSSEHWQRVHAVEAEMLDAALKALPRDKLRSLLQEHDAAWQAVPPLPDDTSVDRERRRRQRREWYVLAGIVAGPGTVAAILVHPHESYVVPLLLTLWLETVWLVKRAFRRGYRAGLMNAHKDHVEASLQGPDPSWLLQVIRQLPGTKRGRRRYIPNGDSIRRAHAEYVHEHGQRPIQLDIAERLGVSRDALQDACKAYDVDWNSL